MNEEKQKTLEGKAKISFMQKGKDFLVGLLWDIKIQTGKNYYKGVILYGIVGLAILGYFYYNAKCNKSEVIKDVPVKQITHERW